MKPIVNNIIPFKGFTAINICGLIFVRRQYVGCVKQRLFNHEAIHTAQMKELGYMLFYILYFIEWIVRLIVSPKNAYRGISFEKEAYSNASNDAYLSERKHFAQWRNSK